MELHEVRHQKAKVIIGKNGLSSGTIKVIQDLVKKDRILKVKILKSALSSDFSKDKLIEDLVSETKLIAIEVRGYTVILSNEKVKKKR